MAFAFTWSAMPSRCSTPAKCLPLVPRAGSMYTTDFAASSVRLNASGVAMSGDGARSFTATPIPTLPSGVPPPATTLPWLS